MKKLKKLNNLKMLLDELLPFYFLTMIFVIMFTAHIPTMFELYIVYAFAFGVAIFNNYLFKTVDNMSAWGDEVLEVVDVMESENIALQKTIADMAKKMEVMENESSSISISVNDVVFASEVIQESVSIKES